MQIVKPADGPASTIAAISSRRIFKSMFSIELWRKPRSVNCADSGYCLWPRPDSCETLCSSFHQALRPNAPFVKRPDNAARVATCPQDNQGHRSVRKPAAALGLVVDPTRNGSPVPIRAATPALRSAYRPRTTCRRRTCVRHGRPGRLLVDAHGPGSGKPAKPSASPPPAARWRRAAPARTPRVGRAPARR